MNQYAPSQKDPQPIPITMSLEKAVPVGGATASTFTWPQAIPLAVWTIPHNLGRYPSVTVVDTTGAKVEPDISYVDSNIIQITHGAAFAGKAYLN